MEEIARCGRLNLLTLRQSICTQQVAIPSNKFSTVLPHPRFASRSRTYRWYLSRTVRSPCRFHYQEQRYCVFCRFLGLDNIVLGRVYWLKHVSPFRHQRHQLPLEEYGYRVQRRSDHRWQRTQVTGPVYFTQQNINSRHSIVRRCNQCVKSGANGIAVTSKC